MTRHHRRTVSDVFNIEVQEDDYALSPTTAHQVVNFGGTSNKCSPSSSSSDFQNTSDSNFLLRTDSAYRRQYHGPNRMMMAAAGLEDGEDGDLDGVHTLEEDEDGDEFDEGGGGGGDENDKEGDGGSSQFETSGGTDCSKASRVAVDVSGFVCLLPYIEKGGKLGGFVRVRFRSFPRRASDDGRPTLARASRTISGTCTTRRSGSCRRDCRRVSCRRFRPNKNTKKLQTSIAALSIDGDLFTTTASDVEQITLELEQREQLMEDNPLSEQLRIEAIKSMAQTLSIKRQIRANLTRTVNRRSVSRSRSVSFLRKCRYRGKMYASRFAKFAKNAFSSFELFYGSMKQIEGHFGSRISAYFKFLRWLLVLNLVLVIFMFWFVTFPQILYSGMEREALSNVTVSDVDGLSRDVLTDFHYTNVFTGTVSCFSLV